MTSYFFPPKVKMAYRINIDGEPQSVHDPNSFDLNILSGGSDLYSNAFHLPLLAYEKGWKFDDKGIPLSERSIDVLYRSSNCTNRRETLASSLRESVENNGFKFVASGGCLAGSSNESIVKSQDDQWGKCTECQDAKMIIAFENNGDGEYLSEKPYLPAEYGAIPIYDGNGLHMFRRSGMNTERMVVHEDAESLNHRVVELLKAPHQLDALYELETGKPSLEPDLKLIREYTCNDPKLQTLKTRDVIHVQQNNPNVPLIKTWLPEALCLEEKTFSFDPPSGLNPDVEVSGCCW